MTKQNIVPMDKFFNKVSEKYDEERETTLPSYPSLYIEFSKHIKSTDEPVEVLDLGVGTGLELSWIFGKMPNAKITCIDLSEKMLEKLKIKYHKFASQITIIQGSYLDNNFSNRKFDYIFSFMTFHHLLRDDKLNLYKNIAGALKAKGVFIEGDTIVQTKAEEDEKYANYLELKEANNIKNSWDYHIDIPLCKKTQAELYEQAGFQKSDIIYDKNRAVMYICTL